jgi:guanylate kinase
MKGRFIIIIGPSASGKTELVNALLKKVPDSARLITMTTRPPRPGEEDGKDYFFITREEFERRIVRGDFLEHAEVYGNLYGQSKEVLDSYLAKFKYVFAIIDVRGARALKAQIPEALTLFIHAGSLEEIRDRLRQVRAGISDAELAKRLAIAAEELAQANDFDAVVENPTGQFEKAVEAVIRLL